MDVETIKKSEFTYWKHYYRDTLGLPDWKVRSESRVNRIVQPTDVRYSLPDNMSLDGKTILDAGCGTAGFLLDCVENFSKFRAYGIDVSYESLQLAKAKLNLFSGPEQRCFITEAALEEPPYPSNSFDYIHCEDVLEHVEKVELCMENLWNLLASGGTLFIHVPDYRWPREPHYKIRVFPNNKWMVRGMLKIRGRPTEFLESLNFMNPQDVVEFYAEEFPRAQIMIKYPSYESLKGKMIGFLSRRLQLKFDVIVQKPR